MSSSAAPRRVPRWFFAILVTALVLAGLEGSLWLVGAGVEAWVRLRRPTAPDTGPQALICAGDSVTFGLNADTDDAYPIVLRGLPALAGRSVWNLGTPGIDSQQLAQSLDEHLHAHPELRGATTLWLVGYNDCATWTPRATAPWPRASPWPSSPGWSPEGQRPDPRGTTSTSSSSACRSARAGG